MKRVWGMVTLAVGLPLSLYGLTLKEVGVHLNIKDFDGLMSTAVHECSNHDDHEAFNAVVQKNDFYVATQELAVKDFKELTESFAKFSYGIDKNKLDEMYDSSSNTQKSFQDQLVNSKEFKNFFNSYRALSFKKIAVVYYKRQYDEVPDHDYFLIAQGNEWYSPIFITHIRLKAGGHWSTYYELVSEGYAEYCLINGSRWQRNAFYGTPWVPHYLS